jgi:hypothetical protein
MFAIIEDYVDQKTHHRGTTVRLASDKSPRAQFVRNEFLGAAGQLFPALPPHQSTRMAFIGADVRSLATVPDPMQRNRFEAIPRVLA